MRLFDFICLFMFLCSLALNIWVICYTIPWKNSTIDWMSNKIHNVIDRKIMDLTTEEWLELRERMAGRPTYPQREGSVTLNKPE